MKVVGLVVEYNPFHNGHLYHLREAKKLTAADYCIAVMSGDFLQRGTPALIDKYSRTEMAIANGVDLVIELPACYATASAEYFARSAVEILNKLNIVDSICFGSECGDISLLTQVARWINEPSDQLEDKIKSYVKLGLTYPEARSQAMVEIYSESYPTSVLEEVLTHPNNILAIEYCKALLASNSKIKPYTIERIKNGYHDINFDQSIVSATAIRHFIAHHTDLSQVQGKVPDSTFERLKNAYKQQFPIFQDDISLLLNYKLNGMELDELVNYFDVSKEIAYRILSNKATHTFTELADGIKAKHITLTRIQRGLLHILLNINTTDMEAYKDAGWVGYARVLGFSAKSISLLSAIKKNSSIPLLTKLSAGQASLDPIWSHMLSNSIQASSIYNLLVWDKYATNLPNDYARKIIKL